MSQLFYLDYFLWKELPSLSSNIVTSAKCLCEELTHDFWHSRSLIQIWFFSFTLQLTLWIKSLKPLSQLNLAGYTQRVCIFSPLSDAHQYQLKEITLQLHTVINHHVGMDGSRCKVFAALLGHGFYPKLKLSSAFRVCLCHFHCVNQAI